MESPNVLIWMTYQHDLDYRPRVLDKYPEDQTAAHRLPSTATSLPHGENNFPLGRQRHSASDPGNYSVYLDYKKAEEERPQRAGRRN